MIHFLDETLKQLLIQKAGLDPSEVDISFDVPTREWSTPVTRPTVNLYLYDIRENRSLRQLVWEEPTAANGVANIERAPARIDLSYLITCWTSAAEDQHRLLWRVLETLLRNSPLPDEILQGDLRHHLYPIRTEVAQPDGVLRNVSDFWGALDNQLRPTISLVVTLELSLEEVLVAPLVLAYVLKAGQRVMPGRRVLDEDLPLVLAPGWELLRVVVGGRVRTPDDQPVTGAAVRLVHATAEGSAEQFGSTLATDKHGRYRFEGVPVGTYTVVVETPGNPPQQQALIITAGERGEPLPTVAYEIVVPSHP